MKQIVHTLFHPENEFFLLTKDSKRITHIALSSFLLPVLVVFISAALTQFVLAPLFFEYLLEQTTPARQAFGLYVMFGISVGILYLWIRHFEGRSFSSIGFTRRGAIYKYAFGFITGVGMNLAVVLIMYLFGCIEIATESAGPTGLSALGGVLIFLLGFIIQGGAEEILARGWMFQVIGAKYKPWIGVIITSVFFAVLHLGNAGVNPFAVINLFLFALLMCLYVMKDGSIWSACAWHSAWNWTMGNVLGLSVSGTGEKTTLIDLNTTGNELISGGGFGPEGSMITTIVLLIAIVWVGMVVLKKK